MRGRVSIFKYMARRLAPLEMKVIEMLPEKIKPKSYIPNIEGFKFIGIDNCYRQHECTVVKDSNTGIHSIKSISGVKFFDLIGFKNER